MCLLLNQLIQGIVVVINIFIVGISEMMVWYGMLQVKGIEPDMHSFGIVIDCYGKEGNIHRMFEFFNKMREQHQLYPNPTIFCSIVHSLGKQVSILIFHYVQSVF